MQRLEKASFLSDRTSEGKPVGGSGLGLKEKFKKEKLMHCKRSTYFFHRCCQSLTSLHLVTGEKSRELSPKYQASFRYFSWTKRSEKERAWLKTWCREVLWRSVKIEQG